MKVYIHIGLIKTGSTFLQRKIFPQFSELSNRIYLGPTQNIHQYNLLSQNISHLLISNENIAGHPLKTNELGTFYSQFDRSIHNLKGLYNSPKIIIGLREPAAFLESVYKQSLHEWGTMTWNQYLVEMKKHYGDIDFYKFILVLKKNFKEKDVFIYDHYEMLNHPDSFYRRLARFLDMPDSFEIPVKSKGNKANASVPYGYESTLLRLNQLSEIMRKNLGLRLAISLGPLRLNPRIFSSVLSNFFPRSSKRDLVALKEEFYENWSKVRATINKKNNEFSK